MPHGVWTDTDNALPDVGTEVLVYVTRGGTSWITTDYRDSHTNEWRNFESHHVTHWAPFPEPPE